MSAAAEAERSRGATRRDAAIAPAAASEAQRRAKVERLREAGIDPYPHSFDGRAPRRGDPRRPRPGRSWGRASTSEFSYRVMGRVTGKRGHGKVVFLDVRDITGTIQAYARRDKLGEEAFERIEELDIGDLVGVEGVVYVTKRGAAGDRGPRAARCWRRRCSTRPTSSTASPTRSCATASANST